MTRRVLMVDDEEDLVWSTVRQMARERSEIVFDGVSDPEEALARIREAPPDLLITDIRMPKMTGLELLLAAREVAPQLPVVVVTAYGSPEVRDEVKRAQSVEYLEKPFSFPALLAAVDKALSRNGGFSGAISLPMLPDLIQIYALAMATGALRITHGAEQGAIWFDSGAIIHASCGSAKGAEAAYSLLKWDGGAFAMEPGAAPPERTIETTWQELLVEGCRRMDEAHRDAPPAGEGADLGHSPGEGAEAVATLWQVLGPHMRETAPDALVVAIDQLRETAVCLQGGGAADPERWAQAVGDLMGVTGRLCGDASRCAVECVSDALGLAVAWDRGVGRAVAFADTLSGRSGPSRFRSNVARWGESCRTWIAGG
jgi:CheY-like chemotaxis protein